MSDNVERKSLQTLHIETLTTGDELISGEWIDQHSRTIGQTTLEHGVHVRRFNSVGDELDDLIAVISEISSRADLCVITGGLGPTEDDLTLDALASVAQSSLHVSEPLWADILSRFPKLSHATESNRRQARIIEGSEILTNDRGTAPGVRVRIGKCTFIAIPGVPQEAQWMISTYLCSWLKERLDGIERYHQVVRVALIGESVIAERVRALNLPESIRVGYQALGTEHRIKISSPHPDLLSSAVHQVRRVSGDNYLNDRDRSLAEQVVETAQAQGITFGFAESCTGGQLSAAVTRISGVSSVFLGGIISYSNEVKQALLGVRKETLIDSGAVSEACAAEMARGARRSLGVDWAVSVTGIAGPEGGSAEKPVGTVCFGWANAHKVTVERKQFSGDRHRIQRTAVAYALFMLLRHLSVHSSAKSEDVKH
jgi:nicotinamide-nucleotide amidase